MSECNFKINTPTPFLGDERFLKTNGANKMLAPFAAPDGTAEQPGFTFQKDRRTGFFFKNGEIWASIDGRTVFPLREAESAYKKEPLLGVTDGANMAYTATSDVLAGTEIVSINGLQQIRGIHYTISGNTITFDEPPESGDILTIFYEGE